MEQNIFDKANLSTTNYIQSKKIQLFWIFDIERVLNIQFFGFSELDLVGFLIIHPIQNSEESWLPMYILLNN
jgi:hypothetical protein